MFLILTVVSVCVSIVSTYLLLNSEDHRWHWLAFLASSSSALYAFAYAVYFYFAKTNMSGVVQFASFFGWLTLGLTSLAMMTGAVGALGTRIFITYIYGYTKAD